MLFREKKELLELYNALNGTDYQNQEELEVYTLENAIYLGVKNDISFLPDSELIVNLWPVYAGTRKQNGSLLRWKRPWMNVSPEGFSRISFCLRKRR